MGKVARCNDADDDPAGAIVRVYGDRSVCIVGCDGVVSMGCVSVLSGARAYVVSVRLDIVVSGSGKRIKFKFLTVNYEKS